MEAYCRRCGARQPITVAASPSRSSNPLQTISPHAASVLCYVPVLGVIACVIFLAADRFRNDDSIRFHAFQGLYLFVAWVLVDRSWGIGYLLHWPLGVRLDSLLHFILFGTWIYMLIQTSQNVRVRLPLLGEWAERSLKR
jgi:uncharacterized membrane protein